MERVPKNQIDQFLHIRGAVVPAKINWLIDKLESMSFLDMNQTGRNDVVLHICQEDNDLISTELNLWIKNDFETILRSHADSMLGNKSHFNDYGRVFYLTIMKYPKNSGIGRHSDIRDGITNKFVSAICYINDNYEGGELVIFDNSSLPVHIKPSAGDVVLLGHGVEHEAMPVTNGEKYVFVFYYDIDLPAS